MSKIAKKPIVIPAELDITIEGDHSVTVTNKSKKVSVTKKFSGVKVVKDGDILTIQALENIEKAGMGAGTVRALLNNVVIGLTKGFEKKLQLVGVGYRAQAQKNKDGGTNLGLVLGFSHPVEYVVPSTIEVEVPTQTEIVLRGSDKQLVGQVAAEIRAFRSPEPYKGKGVRYADEKIQLKEGKKK